MHPPKSRRAFFMCLIFGGHYKCSEFFYDYLNLMRLNFIRLTTEYYLTHISIFFTQLNVKPKSLLCHHFTLKK